MLRALVSVVLLWTPAIAAEPSWSVDGELVDTCNCDLPCPCWKDEKPSKGHCQDMFYFHIDKGSYGAASLDGVDVVQVVVPAEGKLMSQSAKDGDYGVVNMYVSSKLSPQALEGVKKIFSRLALVPAEVGKKHAVKQVALTSKHAGDDVKVEIPKILTAEIKKTNKAYAHDTSILGFTGPSKEAEQVRFDFNDDGFNWKLSHRNAAVMHFGWSSAKGALPGEQPPPAPAAPAKPTKK